MRKVITFTMTYEAWAAMKARSTVRQESMAGFIKRAIEREMARTGPKKISPVRVGETEQSHNNPDGSIDS